MSALCEVVTGLNCADSGAHGVYPGSTFFIDPDNMSALQLLWAFTAYGYVLFVSANMIGDGAELLLLIPSYKDLVASVVLPILGAVPDGMMVLFSGLGPLLAAQENIAVGVGSLAGSTIMLLTLPWVLSCYGGKVDFEKGDVKKLPDGSTAYDQKKSERDNTTGFKILTESGIEFEDGAVENAKIMMGTCLAYFCIQIPAFFVDDGRSKVSQFGGNKTAFVQEVASEGKRLQISSLVGLVVTILMLALYLFLQVKAAKAAAEPPAEDPVTAQGTDKSAGINVTYMQWVADKMPKPAVKKMPDGWLLEKGIRMHVEYLRDRAKEQFESDAIKTTYAVWVASDNHQMKLPEELKKEIAELYNTKAKGNSISQDDMYSAISKIGLSYKREDFNKMYQEACKKNKTATLDSEGFTAFFKKYIVYSATSLPWEAEGDDDDEMPDEFKEMTPDQQRSAILKESFQQMIIGTVLVLIFSDPMVDVLGAIGKISGVPPFYVAFLLAPLASNASELVASFKLASKKSTESITQSLQTLEGAAIMNNTYCLGIFYALMAYQGLAWKFTAETLSIVLVQLLVGAIVMVKKKQEFYFGIIVFLLYPLSLAFVAGLESMGID